ncbi:MAG: hypothetical protein ABSC53_15770 [Bacteroidota bacterium]
MLVGTGSGSYNIDGFTTTGLVTVSAAAGTYTFTGNVNCAGITINGAAVTLNLGAGLTHTSTAAITITTGTLNGGSSTLNISFVGTAFTNAGTFTPGTGTVNYSGAGIQTALATTYYNLSLSGTNAKTVTGITTIGADFNMSGSATATPVITTVGGNVNISGTAVMTTGANNVVTGSLTVGTGATLTMDGFSLSIGGTSSITGTVNTVTSTNGTKTFTGAVTINSGGVWNLSTTNPATSFGGGITMSGTTFNNGTGTAAFSANQSLLGANAMTFGGTVTPAVSTTLTNSNSGTVTISSIVLTGNFTQGVYTPTLTLTAAAPFSGTGTFDASTNTNTVTYTGASAAVNAVTYSNLTINGSGTATIGGTTVVKGTMTVSSATTNNSTLTVTTALSGASTLTQGASSTLNIGGTSGITGLDASTNANTVNYTGAGQTIHSNNYNNLTLSGSGTDVLQTGTTTISGNLTLSGTVTTTTVVGLAISGNLVVGSGTTLTLAGYTFTVTGTSSITGTVNTVIAATGTKTFTGAVTINSGGVWDLSTTTPATSFGGGITMSGTTFNNGTGAAAFSANQSLLGANAMTFGGTVTPANGTTLTNSNSGTVTISSIVLTGGFTQGSNTPTLALTAAAPFSGAGTFDAHSNTNTVNYTGASAAVLATTYSSLTINGTGTATIGGTTVVNGTMTLTSGTLTVGANMLTLNGPTIAGIPANLSTTSSSSLVFGGSSSSVNIPSSITALNNLTINNANGVALNSSPTISGALTFTNGILTTGSNTLSLGSSATVSGAGTGTGWVNGSLLWNLPNSGSPTKVFCIGDASNYTPVQIVFNTLSGTAGSLTVKPTSGQYPSISTSGINSSKDVARYWTLTNSGVTVTSYDATFNFVSGDVIGGANTNNFVVRRYSSGWTAPTTGTKTSTSTAATGLTAYGDFVIGEQQLDHFTFVLATPQSNGVAFIGTNTLTAQDVLGVTITAFDASADNVTIAANSPLTGSILGLSGTNKLTSAGDFSSGVANMTTRMIYTGNTGSGTFTATSASGKTGTTGGSVTINATTYIWNQTGTNSWQVTTNWTPTRTTPATSDVIQFNGGGSVTVTSIPTQTIAQLILSNNSTVNLQGSSSTLTVNDALSTTASDVLNFGTDVVLNGTLTTLTNNGKIKTSSTNATPIPSGKTWSGTIEYTAAAGVQTVVAGTYNNLTLDNTSGTNSAGGNLTVNSTLTTTSGGTLDMITNTLSVSSVSHSGILNTQNTSATPITSGKTWGGTVNFNGTGSQSIGGSSSTFNILKINNAAGVTLGVATTTSTLTIGDVTSNSIFSDGGYQLTSTGTLNLTSGNFSLGSAGTATTFPAFAANNISAGTTVTYASGVAQPVSATPNYQNLTFSGAGTKTPASGTLTIGSNWTVGSATALNTNNPTVNLTGNMTETANLTVGTGAINIGGNWTLTSGTFTAGTGTVNFDGTGSQTINGSSSTFNILKINNAAGVTLGVATTTSTLTIGDVTSNSIFSDGGYQITGNAAGSLSMASSSNLILGNSTIGTTFPTNFVTANITLNSASTVTYNSDQSQTVSAVPTYGNIVFNGAGLKTLGSSTTATGNVTINSGAPVTVNNSVTLQINGNFSSYGSLTNSGTISVGN